MEATATLEPVAIGPCWKVDPDWDHVDPSGQYIVPKLTLGWQVLAWVHDNLLSPDSTPDEPLPFEPTLEQKRFILWWYAIDESGRFLYRDGVLQRLKGWGKDPIAAVLSAVEFVGPCRFAGWLTVDRPDLDLVAGEPLAKVNPVAWIQIAAVSKDQTRNTMTLFPSLFTKECIREHGIDIGKELIYAYKGARRIEAVTSSPRALEGGRPTFVIRNETHHWLANNEGHEMAAVIERNATKSKDGAARALSITNAYNPQEESVAQLQREAWENEEAGLSIKTGVLYDSLEADEHAQLRPPKKYEYLRDPVTGEEVRLEIEPTDQEVIDHLVAIIESIRGDSVWLDSHRIAQSILDGVNPASRSRRFWFNQIVASEDAWLDPDAITIAINSLAREARDGTDDILRAGWIVLPDDPCVMFFDGSKSDDATALVGCRLSDGFVFTIGVWQRPPKSPKQGKPEAWLAPREEVDLRVDEAFERFNIVAFWGDPSHAIDDADATRYWDPLMDKWHRKYSGALQFWSMKTGERTHSIMWDMASPLRSQLFTAAAETFVQELHERNDIEEYAPAFQIDGHPALVQHLRNAKDYPNQWGTSLWKGHRESSKKIDLAVAAVGARMLRRVALNIGVEEEKPAGTIWGAW